MAGTPVYCLKKKKSTFTNWLANRVCVYSTGADEIMEVKMIVEWQQVSRWGWEPGRIVGGGHLVDWQSQEKRVWG